MRQRALIDVVAITMGLAVARAQRGADPGAVDATTGRELWRATTRETTATPMTYRGASGRQFVVIATGRGTDATLVAFARPS